MYLPGSRAHGCDELADVRGREGRRRHEQVGRDPEHRHRCEVAVHVVGRALHQRVGGDRAGRSSEDRVPVRRRLGGRVGADRPSGAGAVLRHHWLAQLLGEFLREDAAGEVGGLPGRPGDDHADRAIGIALCPSAPGRASGGQRRRQEHAPPPDHVGLLPGRWSDLPPRTVRSRRLPRRDGRATYARLPSRVGRPPAARKPPISSEARRYRGAVLSRGAGGPLRPTRGRWGLRVALVSGCKHQPAPHPLAGNRPFSSDPTL